VVAVHPVASLRVRAAAIRAYEAMPSLRERLLAAFPTHRGGTNVTPLSPSLNGRAEQAPAAVGRAA
jgi:hypothetical protein